MYPCSFRGGFKLLLDFYLLDKIQVCLLAYCGIDLLQCPFFFCDPDRSGEGQVLRAFWKKIEAVAKVVADVNTIGQVVIIIKTPAVRYRRDKILAHDVQPVLVEIIFLERRADKLCDECAILNSNTIDLRLKNVFISQSRALVKIEFRNTF